jgi:hypothetical protein
VVPGVTCDYCGRALDTIIRAADDTPLEVLANPHERGDWMRVNARGRPEHGKYIKLAGTSLAAARAEGVILYLAHTREVCRRG